MAQFAIKKLSFIGGSLRPVGSVAEVPEEILTPRSQRENDKSGRDDNVRVANSNLAPVGKGVPQAIVAMAPIAPTGPNPVRPQQVPAGAVESGALFTNAQGATLVAAGSVAEANAPTGETTTEVIEEQPERAFDHDGDGEAGGSKPAEPPSLSGKNKAELQKIATAEGVTFDEGMTNAQLTEAIAAKRG
jgi:hypothetical protein